MKKLKIWIIVFSIIIVLLILAIIIIKNSQQIITNEEEKSPNDTGQVIEFDNTNKKVVDNDIKFFTVKNCVQQYIDTINLNNDRYFGYGENGEYRKIVSDEQIASYISVLLSNQYKEENRINESNLYDYINTTQEKLIFIPLKMNVITQTNIEKYIVYGIQITVDGNYDSDIYIVVNLDVTNSTFSIEPLSSNYDNIDEIDLQNNNERIDQNTDNKYSDQKINNEYIAKYYFTTYKQIILTRPDLVYDYLQEDYKLQRFGTLENFEKYVESSREEIAGLQIQKYLVNNYEDYIEFVCMDQYQNLYIFDETNPMDFTLKLDSYTIISDNFKEKFDSSNEQYKVAMNIDKWVQMLNNRDYTHAYEVLDETFKSNNWGSVEAFEQYMRESFPLHYEVEYATYSSEGSTYVQQINLTDITGKTEGTISLNIIMQLKDNYEFVMSFSVQE